MKKILLVFLPLYVLCTQMAFGQNAASDKVASRYTSEQLADLQSNTPYKYQGLLLFYAESWFIEEQGSLRLPTEDEIRSVDIDKYTPARSEDQRVNIHDAESGLNLVLMGRKEFEQLYMGRLNANDLQAYLAYKSAFENTAAKSAK